MSFFQTNNQPPPEDTELEPGDVTEEILADDSVSTEKLQDGSVTEDKLADDSVSTEKLQDDAVNGDKLADNSVSQAHMTDNSIGTAEIINSSVTPAKLALAGNNFTVKGQWMKISPGAGTGPLAGYFGSAATSATEVTGYISGNEHGIQFLMPDSNEAGGLVPLFANLFTSMNLNIVVRWQSTADNNSENMWIGLVDDLADDMTASAYPDDKEVFLFGKKNGESNWGTIRNDGSGTATKSNTKTFNTTVNKTTITTTSTTLTTQHNAEAANQFTTDIPTSTTPLALVIWYNAESTTDKTFRILDVEITYDFKTGQ